MNLFQTGNFTLSSGVATTWKIECDALKSKDWDTLARMAVQKLQRIYFNQVIPVPKGKSASEIDNALNFVEALRRYSSPIELSNSILIADDVYTTGKSIRDCRLESRLMDKNVVGVVAFARAPIKEDWVIPVFQY